jgi:hypothetical protein
LTEESRRDEASVLIVIRAWHEHHPDAPFRAAITIQTHDETPERLTVASVEDALSTIRARLDVVGNEDFE